MVQVWVSTIRCPRFQIDVKEQDEIVSVKNQIIDYLQSKFSVYVPPVTKLVYQGALLTDKKKIQELHVENDENFLFLFDLNAKPPPPPQEVAPVIPTQSLIDSLVSSWSQRPAFNTPAAQLPIFGNTTNYPTYTNNTHSGLNNSDSSIENDINNNFLSNAYVSGPQDAQRETMLKIINSQDFFPDQESLAILMSMGFSKSRARKALVINFFEPQAAAEWILLHSSDPDIDAPLTEAQIDQILSREALENDSLNLPVTPPPVNTLPAVIPPPIVTPPPVVNQPPPVVTQPVVTSPPPATDTPLQNAVKNRVCTFTVTGTKHADQNWYHCFTCGLVDSEGACESCINVCHAGHTISDVKTGLFYCDCGNNPTAHNCKCCK